MADTVEHTISVTVPNTGEVLTFNVATAADIAKSYDEVLNYIETYRRAKQQILERSMAIVRRSN